MRFIIGEVLSFIGDKAGQIADIVTGGSQGNSTHNKKRLSTQATITGRDGAHEADVALIDGKTYLNVFGIQAIESLRGFDPQADTWFYIGTELDSEGAGAAGDEVRVQIAAGDDPTDFPAVDVTYTLLAEDADDEEELSLNLSAALNADTIFKELWRAQRIPGNGAIYITARKPGSQFERPNVGDFVVSSTGTTVVTAAFDNIIRRNKITGLARDPADPRQGQLGIQGSVVQTQGGVTDRFQTVFSNLLVDGSVTPVDFTINNDPSQVKFVTNVILAGIGNGIKFEQFLSRATLTNGIVVSFRSQNFEVSRKPLRRTEDLLDLHAEDPDNFSLFIASGGDKIIAVLSFLTPLELRPQGEFAIDDYLKITVNDDLTFGITSLRAIVNGFVREF